MRCLSPACEDFAFGAERRAQLPRGGAAPHLGLDLGHHRWSPGRSGLGNYIQVRLRELFDRSRHRRWFLIGLGGASDQDPRDLEAPSDGRRMPEVGPKHVPKVQRKRPSSPVQGERFFEAGRDQLTRPEPADEVETEVTPCAVPLLDQRVAALHLLGCGPAGDRLATKRHRVPPVAPASGRPTSPLVALPFRGVGKALEGFVERTAVGRVPIVGHGASKGGRLRSRTGNDDQLRSLAALDSSTLSKPRRTTPAPPSACLECDQ
jgi:hypothetical protein